MDFMDSPEQGHSFIDDEVSAQEGMQVFQNPDPLKAQAALLALTQKSVTQAHDSYLKMVNGSAESLESISRQTQEQAEASLDELKTAIPGILTDPNVSEDEKFKLVDAVRNGRLKAPDVAQRLHAAALLVTSHLT